MATLDRYLVSSAEGDPTVEVHSLLEAKELAERAYTSTHKEEGGQTTLVWVKRNENTWHIYEVFWRSGADQPEFRPLDVEIKEVEVDTLEKGAIWKGKAQGTIVRVVSRTDEMVKIEILDVPDYSALKLGDTPDVSVKNLLDAFSYLG